MATPDERATDVAICPSCGERNPAHARFCMACGARMEVETGERRTVSVLFADLSGFTSYSETVDPEAVRAVAEAAAGRLGEIVTRYGGTVDKIIGDCVMAVWGAPSTHEDDPERAVRSGLAMQAEVGAHPEAFAGLGLSVGIHTGEAIWAPVGPAGDHTVLGDTVNTAARLQGAAAAGEVLVGAPTARAVTEAIELVEIPALQVKNKAEPVPAWRAVGVKGERASTATISAFQGRTMSMRRLAELWERARTERRAYFAGILGAPGLGKSRLIREFRASLRGDARVLTGRCLPYGEGSTYWPISQIIREAAELSQAEDEELVAKKLGILLESLSIDDLDQLRTIAVATANLVAAATTPRGTYTAEHITRSELHWGMRRLFHLLAQERPLLLIMEGFDRAEPALLELISSVVETPAPILVLGTGSPALAARAPALFNPHRNGRLIGLEELADEQSLALLASLDGLDDRATQLIVASAAGSPLYLEEAWRSVADGTDPAALPADIPGLIARRLEGVSGGGRAVAARAALVGQVFWTGAVAHLSEHDPALALAELEEHDLIRRRPMTSLLGEDEWEFRHIMVLQEAQARLEDAERAGLHARLAAWIESLPGSNRELLELVAHHREQACVLDPQATPEARARACDTLVLAGRTAENREAYAEAERAYERALAVIAGLDPPREAELRLLRARRVADQFRGEEAIALTGPIVEEAERLGMPTLACRALVALAMLRARSAPESARDHLARADELVTSLGDRRLALDRALVSGALRVRSGDRDGGLEELSDAVALAGADCGKPEQIRAHQELAWGLLEAGRLPEAERNFTIAAELARAQGSLRAEIASVWVLAELAYFIGPREESERLARLTLEWLERIPDRLIAVRMHERLAALALARGDVAGAERSLREAYGLARREGGTLLVESARRLAQVHLRQGRMRDAERMVRTARRAAPEADEDAVAALRLVEAYVAAGRGDAHTARTGFAEGIAALADRPIELAQTRMVYARSLIHLGDLPRALEELRLARATFSEMGAAAMVADIDELASSIEAREGVRP